MQHGARGVGGLLVVREYGGGRGVEFVEDCREGFESGAVHGEVAHGGGGRRVFGGGDILGDAARAMHIALNDCLNTRRGFERGEQARGVLRDFGEHGGERVRFSVELVGGGKDHGLHGVELERAGAECRGDGLWRADDGVGTRGAEEALQAGR